MNLSNYFIHPHYINSIKVSADDFIKAINAVSNKKEIGKNLITATDRVFKECLDYIKFSKNCDFESSVNYFTSHRSIVGSLLKTYSDLLGKDEDPLTTSLVHIFKIIVGSCENGRINSYLIQSDMLKLLVDTDLSDFKKEFFPKNFGCYIAFEKGLINTEGFSYKTKKSNIEGVYCRVSNIKEKTVIGCIVISRDSDGDISYSIPSMSLDEILQSSTNNNDLDESVHAKSLMKTIMLAIMYVHSGQRDVRVLKSSLKFPPSQLKGLKNKDPNYEENYSEDILDDVFLVGFNWKKDPLYTKEYWGVRAFFREQAHGPGMSLRRLIWIAPHQAHRRKPLAGNPVDDYEFYFDDNF
jgi:hypothetical protein